MTISLLHHSRLKGINHNLTDSDVESLAASAHGFVGADIAQVWVEGVKVACHSIDSSSLNKHSMRLNLHLNVLSIHP